jgi:hypothetical protein
MSRDLPPRVVLLGTPKVGKTTFAASAPDAILLPIKGEEGADEFSIAKFPTANTFEDVLEALTSLANEAHGYKTIIIDSASALERLIWEKTCRENKWTSIEQPGFGKGYNMAVSKWVDLINALDVLREKRHMGSILIGHVKVKLFNDPMADPYDQYIWDVNDKAASTMLKWADCCLFAKTKVNSAKTGGTTHAYGQGERVLLTQERPSHPGGGRAVYGRLPYELPLSYEAWIKAIVNANNKIK